MNIYIRNFPRTTSEDALRSLFEQFGQVSSVKIIKDKFTGEARGFAFVEMPDNNEAQQAINELNGSDLEGQKLVVNEARPRENRPQQQRRRFR